MELRVNCVKDLWTDCVISIEYDKSLDVSNVESISFYMSNDDFRRFACFLVDQLHVECDDRYPFVTTNLGFELSILDADELEATVQILLNVGMNRGNRVYIGCQGQVLVSELQQFASILLNLI